MNEFEEKYWDAQRKIDEYERERAADKQAVIDITEENLELKRTVKELVSEKEKYRKMWSKCNIALSDIYKTARDTNEECVIESRRLNG